MQQFTVPQFIDVEDKIIGPLTTRQFLILLTGSIFIGLCYRLLNFWPFVAVGLLILAISGTFAFLRINGMPFHFFVLNFVQTLKKPGLRVWSQPLSRIPEEVEMEPAKQVEIIRKKEYVPTSRLSELALMVDTRGAYRGEQSQARANSLIAGVKDINV